MSWDTLVQDIPQDVTSVSDMPDDFAPRDLDKRDSIIAGIRRLAPDADFTDPSWGTIVGPGYSIEVNLGDADTVQSFVFHVRGGDDAACVVHDILQELELRAFDPSSPSGIFDGSSASPEGFRRWREYRDRVPRGGT